MGIFGSKRNKKHRCEDYSYLSRGSRKVKKPVLYLYPEEITDVEIKLALKNSKFTCIYPKFNESENTWKVKAFMEKYQSLIKNIHIFSGKLIPMLHKI